MPPSLPHAPKTASPGQKARAALGEVATATAPSAIQIVPGFTVELLYTVLGVGRLGVTEE